MKSIEEINKARTEWQRSMFDEFKKAGGRGIVVAATGVGKTRIATHQIIPKMNLKNKQATTKVVVPKVFLKEDWDVKGGHIDKLKLKNVETWVVNTFITKRHICNFLVLDECHRYSNEGAEFFKLVLSVCQFDMVLGLTASLSQEQEEFLRSKNIPVIGRLTTREAERLGFISPYQVFNLAVSLTDEDREEADRLEENFVKYKDKLGHYEAFDLAREIVPDGLFPKFRGTNYQDMISGPLDNWREPRAVTFARQMGWHGVSMAQGVANYRRRCQAPRGTKKNIVIWEDDKDDHEYTPTKVYHYARQYLGAMHERLNYLHTAQNKLEAVKEIVKKFNKKAIIFSQRTSFADQITALLGTDCESYHSNLESRPVKKNGDFIRYKSGKQKGEPKMFGATSLKKMIIQDFKDNKIKYISTVTTLDEGFDVPDVSLAIIVSSTGKERQNTQRIGRVVRAEEGKFATVINLYIPDTQDEKWLRDRQKEDKPAIYVDTIDQILNTNYSNVTVKDDDFDSADSWEIEL